MKSEKLRSKTSSPSIDSATSALKLNYDIIPISPRGRDAIQSRSSIERAGISSFRRNVWLRVYCLGGETYKPIIPLFLRSLAENREKKRKEADMRRNGLNGTGKKSVFHDPLSDVAEPHEVSIPLVDVIPAEWERKSQLLLLLLLGKEEGVSFRVKLSRGINGNVAVATMIGHLGEENIQWSFPGDFLTEEKVGAIRRQEDGEPRYSTKAVEQKVRKETTELFFHGGKRLRDVNDKNEIKSASFPSCGFVPFDRYSDTPVFHCPRWIGRRCDWQFKTNAANRDIACTTRGNQGRVIGGFMLHRSARTRHDHLGHAFSASSLSHLVRSRRRIESGGGGILRHRRLPFPSPSLLCCRRKRNTAQVLSGYEACSDSSRKK
ncbi:hypothetical protein G5I_10743 [Acromyrmex echinatior]|uniref:Uncharacterized protein n=1 Tax=Acromyrmex echinatior TaxID=103372 RepID=F4WXQ3_ACREC|nr:hypothetical protein G5I_10743 [Acromyrmex echinatior]